MSGKCVREPCEHGRSALSRVTKTFMTPVEQDQAQAGSTGGEEEVLSHLGTPHFINQNTDLFILV